MKSARALGPLAVLLALLGSSAGAERVTVSGYLENDTAYRIRSPYYTQKSQTHLEIEVEARLLDSLSLHAIGRSIWDPPRRLVGPDPDFGQKPVDRWYVAGTRSLEAELREAYIDWSGQLGPALVDVRLGKQQYVWGDAIGLRIIDIANAQDFREFVLDDFVDARIPTFGIRVDALIDEWSVQVFAVPDFEQDRLAGFSTEFAFDPELPGLVPTLALTPPLPMMDVIAEIPIQLTFPGSPLTLEFPVTVNAGALVAGIQPPSFPLVIVEDEDVPRDWRLSSTAFGLRIARLWKGFDLALYYHDALDTAPAIRRRIEYTTVIVPIEVPTPDFSPAVVEPESFVLEVPVPLVVNRIRSDHVRVRSVGASFATAFGSFAFWGEGIARFGRAFVVDDLSDDDGVVRSSEIRYALGLDYMGWDHVFIGVQWIQQILPSHRSTMELDKVTSFLSLLVRLELRNATVFPQVFAMYGLNERDSWIRPSVEWKATDNLSFTIGADVFTGNRSGLFGQFAARRRCTDVSGVPSDLLPGLDASLADCPEGRASRAFLQVRYSFDFSF